MCTCESALPFITMNEGFWLKEAIGEERIKLWTPPPPNYFESTQNLTFQLAEYQYVTSILLSCC